MLGYGVKGVTEEETRIIIIYSVLYQERISALLWTIKPFWDLVSWITWAIEVDCDMGTTRMCRCGPELNFSHIPIRNIYHLLDYIYTSQRTGKCANFSRKDIITGKIIKDE